ncbi:MAG: hypothetical protein KatS3mg090_0252 [Patescibacteria group bacterium]|nr:MAG: hypothetical protein KatS3mg090_0252 [Patescibacteria group bacterium]
MLNMLDYFYKHTVFKWFFESLWRDEAFSVLLAKKNVGEIFYLSAKDFTPPLYYLVLKFWMIFFGDSELAVRSLSFILYLACIYMFFLILEALKLKGRILYILTFIFASFPSILYYAFEARPYIMLVLLSLIFYYSILVYDRRLNLISGFLGIFTHYFFVFNIISQYLFCRFVDKGKKHRPFLNNVFFLLVLFSPWLFFLIYIKSYIFHSDFWVQPLTPYEYFESFFWVLTGYIKGWEPKFGLTSITSLILNVFLAWAIFDLFKNYKKDKRKFVEKDGLLFFCWALIPVVFALSISVFKPSFVPRYLIFTVPGLFLFLINRYQSKSKLFYSLLVFLLVLNMLFLNHLINKRKKYNWAFKLGMIKIYAQNKKAIYLKDYKDYPVFIYYMPEFKNRIYLVSQSKDSLPAYIGKVIYPEDKYRVSLPITTEPILVFYDNGRFVLESIH